MQWQWRGVGCCVVTVDPEVPSNGLAEHQDRFIQRNAGTVRYPDHTLEIADNGGDIHHGIETELVNNGVAGSRDPLNVVREDGIRKLLQQRAASDSAGRTVADEAVEVGVFAIDLTACTKQ